MLIALVILGIFAAAVCWSAADDLRRDAEDHE